MLDRMRGGRWKVFKGDNDAWLDEVRTYHRDAKTGLIVKEADDAISASRYGMMSLRHARTDAAKADFQPRAGLSRNGALLMSKDFQTIFVQMRRPRDGDPGVTEPGYFRVEDDVVVLVDKNGVPRINKKGKRLITNLKPGQNARKIAALLVRDHLPDYRGDFQPQNYLSKHRKILKWPSTTNSAIPRSPT